MYSACLARSIGNPNVVTTPMRCAPLQTALHVASSKGMLREVDYLIRHKADLDIKDRWGVTPLLEAVKGNHQILVELFKASGARIPSELGVSMLCEAAGDGDL